VEWSGRKGQSRAARQTEAGYCGGAEPGGGLVCSFDSRLWPTSQFMSLLTTVINLRAFYLLLGLWQHIFSPDKFSENYSGKEFQLRNIFLISSDKREDFC